MLRRICRVRSGEEARKLLAPFLSAYPEAILLAPTRAAADELVFTLPGSFGIHRRTLSQLAIEAAAAELASRGLTPIAGLTAEALASRAIHELRRQKRLTYFDPVADTPGFPQAAARTIRELRLQRISPTKLSRAGASERDLGLMLRAWSSLLDEFSLADEAVVFDLAAGAKDSPLLGLPLLALDAAIRNRSEIAFLRAILERSSTVIATVSEGDLESESAWRTLLGVPSEESATEPATQLEALRTGLFVSTSAATLNDSSVDFFSSPGESSECVEIARRVHALAREGVRLDGIAILLRQPERYQPLVEDALRRAGITAWFSRGVRRPDPAGRAFLTLLKCGEEGLSASRFAEYLSLAQIPLKNAAEEFQAPTDEIGAMLLGTGEEEWSTVEPERTPPAPANWERMLVDAAVIGGADRWKRRLDGLAAELRLRLDAIGDDNGDRTLAARHLDQLDQLRTFALPLIGELDSLPKAAKWDEWLPRLQALARLALRNPYGVLTLLAELEPLTAVGPVSLAEVAEVLTPHLSTLRLEPPKRRFGSVLVAGIEEARGRVFDAAFVPGLAEGIFPQRIREDPLLLDSTRERLDLNLARRETHTARERSLLQMAAGAARRMVFSYPTMDMGLGRGRVPSLYALEVERAARGTVGSLDEFERCWRAAASARLGWPAPEHPRDAIDDSEYDLAVLANIRHDAPAAQVRGKLSFLLENPHAARALRARYRRWEMRTWTVSDGLFDVNETVAAMLAQRSLKLTAYSPTSLQQWAACPYRFYLGAILHLREREEAESIEQLDPRTRGEIFHAVQFRILTALRDAGALPVTKASFDSALTVADRELDGAAAEYRERLAPAIPAVWLAEIESIRTDLRGWLYDVALDQGRWTPLHYELRFGLASSGRGDAASTAAEAIIGDGYRLRGAIDLIERENATGQLRIVDHKTGRQPDLRDFFALGRGEVLQPVLYSLAAEAILGERVSSGDLFYCTQSGGYERRSVRLNDATRDRAQQALAAVDETLTKGILPAAPRREACATCDFQSVCGPSEERRILHKPLRSLRELSAIRSLP